jgi:thiamine-phosphate diphosphorylase
MMSDVSRRFAALLAETRVYAVTDDGLTSGEIVSTVESLLAAGVRLFQYRDKRSSDRERAEVARALTARVHTAGGLLIVNDRADVALAAGADGVHLGQDDLPLEAGRAMLGADHLLGASASFLEELPAAIRAGVDYLGFGAVFATETKPDAEYAGLDLLEKASREVSIPVVGIGGISVERAPQVLARGAAGVAVVSALFRAPNPAEAAQALLAALR